MSEMKENRMGVEPVNQLIIKLALPMMLSMIINSMYNIVDSVFVAQINEDALTAVSMAFPVQNLLISVQVGMGVGMNALLSRQLGEGNQRGARLTAANGLVLSFFHSLLFILLGLTMVDTFFHSQTNNPQILQYGKEYLSIIMIFSAGQAFQIIFERLLQSTGKTIYSMYTQAVGSIINIVLDPILIFGWFGLPALGVAGAAYATVIGQILGALVGLYFQQKKNTDLPIDYREVRPNLSTIREIYRVGIPSMVMSSITSVTTFAFNIILAGYSSTAVAVYGVYFKLQSFVFMPVFGLNNGVIPILSYNFGAQKKDRMLAIIKYSILYAVLIMLTGLVIFQLFPSQLLAIFNASDSMMAIGVPALRTISLCFLFAGFGIMSSTIFQAFGKGMMSLAVSVLRQLVILIPVAYLLSLTGTLEAIWWAYPLAELFAVALCAVFLRKVIKTFVTPAD